MYRAAHRVCIALVLTGALLFAPGDRLPAQSGVAGELRVVADVLRVRAEPTTDSAIIAHLQNGAGIVPLGRVSLREASTGVRVDWYRVHTSDDVTGWVHGNYVRLAKSLPHDRTQHIFIYTPQHAGVSGAKDPVPLPLFYYGSFTDSKNTIQYEEEVLRSGLQEFVRGGVRPVMISNSGKEIGQVQVDRAVVHMELPGFAGIEARIASPQSGVDFKDELCAAVSPGGHAVDLKFSRRTVQDAALIENLFAVALAARSAQLSLGKTANPNPADFTQKICRRLTIAGRILYECNAYPRLERGGKTYISFVLESSTGGAATGTLLDFQSEPAESDAPRGGPGIRCATDLDGNGLPELWIERDGYCGETVLEHVHLLRHTFYTPPRLAW